MKLTLKVTRHTTDSELIHLGNFFTALGANRGARAATFTVPMDEAELQEPETPVVGTNPTTVTTDEVSAGTEPPKRRRRTKEEVAAACAVAAGSNGASHAEPVTQPEEVAAAIAADPELAATVGNDQPADTGSETPVTSGSATIAATAPPSEAAAPTGPITHAEAQKQAIDVARRFGPEKVKAIISSYEGVGKIADLKDDDLVGFVAKLQALAA